VFTEDEEAAAELLVIEEFNVDVELVCELAARPEAAKEPADERAGFVAKLW